MTRGRPARAGTIVVVSVGVALAAALRLMCSRTLEGEFIFGWPEPDILRFRVTALLVATIVGSALAISGMLLQTLLRNPLASPYVLGLSSAAGLSVAIGLSLGIVGTTFIVHLGLSMCALVGAGGAMLIVYILGSRRGGIDPLALILSGVIVAAMSGALTMFLQYVGPPELLRDIIFWTFGRIRTFVDLTQLAVTGGVVALCIASTWMIAPAMDVATFSDAEARSIGVSIRQLRTMLFVLSGVLAGLAVSLAGPIGFVGLIAPHAGRALVGSRHRGLVIVSVLLGAGVLIGADLVSQLFVTPTGRLPVGIVTAIVGGPIFLWILRSSREIVEI